MGIPHSAPQWELPSFRVNCAESSSVCGEDKQIRYRLGVHARPVRSLDGCGARGKKNTEFCRHWALGPGEKTNAFGRSWFAFWGFLVHDKNLWCRGQVLRPWSSESISRQQANDTRQVPSLPLTGNAACWLLPSLVRADAGTKAPLRQRGPCAWREPMPYCPLYYPRRIVFLAWQRGSVEHPSASTIRGEHLANAYAAD